MWIFIGILTYILFWLTCIVSYTIHYLTTTIQITSFSQVIYTLNAGAEGAEGTVGTAVAGFFAAYWPLLILGTLLFGGYLYLCSRRKKAEKAGVQFFAQKKIGTVFNCTAIGTAVLMTGLLGARVGAGYSTLGVGEYLANANRVSDLYENHFVEPDEVELTFPEKKRNLIMIVVESLESSFTSKEQGGGYSDDLIPNLYSLAKEEGTDFSPKNTQDLNGALVANNTGWTIAGLVAQTASVPLNVGNADFCRNFQSGDAFMPHLTTLGDILKEEGYHNYFMCGSDAAYAGRANYFRQHGDYTIFDYNEAKREKFIPEDYSVWWGYEDLKLFDWAEKKLPEIAKNDSPFNFTMLTADTHFQDGYLCPECDDQFDSRYENVIACSDRQISEFVKWVQKQDFYKDTTIVITGDHLSMDGSVPATTGAGYARHAFATVINGPEYTLDKTREYTTMDMFPTILEAMGVQIEGHRLGLGTSLYSDAPTLVEQLGLPVLNAEVSADSNYYTDVIMNGDQTKKVEKPEKKPEDTSEKDSSEVPSGNDAAQNVIVPLSAQDYQANQDKFQDPDYVYTPVAEPVYTDPGYTNPGYTNPGYVDPGYTDPGYTAPVEPTPPADPTPTPPADSTVTPPADSTITPPADSTVTPPSDPTPILPSDPTPTPPVEPAPSDPAGQTPAASASQTNTQPAEAQPASGQEQTYTETAS